MANLFGMDLGGLDIPKMLNSRLGLVVLFIAYTSSPWGLGTKIDELVRNSDRMVAATEQTRELSESNHDMLLRMMERCKITESVEETNRQTANRPKPVELTE